MDLLIMAAKAAEKRLDRILAAYGLTYPQYQVLRTVREGASPLIGSVAGVMGCTRGNLTVIADRLERAGWLTRERSMEDRRAVRLCLVDPARVDQVSKAVTPLLNELMPAEVEQYLVRVLREASAEEDHGGESSADRGHAQAG